VSIFSMVGRTSSSSFAGRMMRLPLRLIPRNAVVRVLSGVNRGQRWIAGANNSNALWIGTYEADHVSAIQKLIHPGMVIYDVGANAGYYTLAFSRLVGESGHIFSFEPEARNADLLRRHLKMNHINNVSFVQTAVSNAVGMAGFEGAASTGRISDVSSYLVPTTSLDEFVAAGNPPPSLVKMDIEGGEIAGLEGARGILEQRNTLWMLATHGAEIKSRCIETLRSYGYRLTGFDGVSPVGNEADFLAFPPSK
jgi:FkbM family methyltransferase